MSRNNSLGNIHIEHLRQRQRGKEAETENCKTAYERNKLGKKNTNEAGHDFFNDLLDLQILKAAKKKIVIFT